MNKNDIFITYRHFRNETFDEVTGLEKLNPKGGATLAFFVDLRDPENRYAIVGYSICSDKDHFSKEQGRKVAYTRLSAARSALKMASPGSWYYGLYADSKFLVLPKNEGGTLCEQFLEHLRLLDRQALLFNGGDMQQLLTHFEKHSII
jgi:hypothetical protein